MQDRPELDAVLDGIAAVLAELRDAAPPELRRRAAVAAYALGVVRRELAAGDAPARAERERIVALLGREAEDAWDARRKLARAIRDGRHDDEIPRVAAVLRDSVRAKLAIASPGWDAVSDDGRG